MEELVKKAQEGNEEAFTNLIISIETELYKIAKMRLQCDDDVNEAVQETIIQAFKSIRKLKQPQYFKTWIIRILINNCNSIYRKLKKDNSYFCDNLEILSENYSYNEEQKNNELDFFILIKILNYKERISITLYYLENLTTKEISRILKEPESTIRNRICRALKKLENYYEKEDKKNERYRM